MRGVTHRVWPVSINATIRRFAEKSSSLSGVQTQKVLIEMISHVCLLVGVGPLCQSARTRGDECEFRWDCELCPLVHFAARVLL